MSQNRVVAEWTLIRGSRIPIIARLGTLSAIVVVNESGSVVNVRVQDGDMVGWVGYRGRSNVVTGATAELVRVASSSRDDGGVEYLGRSLQQPTSADIRWMLVKMRQLQSSRSRSSPDWAKRIWEDGEILVAKVLPFRLGGQLVGGVQSSRFSRLGKTRAAHLRAYGDTGFQ